MFVWDGSLNTKGILDMKKDERCLRTYPAELSYFVMQSHSGVQVRENETPVDICGEGPIIASDAICSMWHTDRLKEGFAVLLPPCHL